MFPIRLHERAGAGVWLAAPAILSALSQFGAVAFFARHGGASRALEFQTMLSLWAWTLVGAFGLDRAARAFAFDQTGLGAYANAWRMRLAAVWIATIVLGGVVGASQPEGVGAWVVYGLCLGSCAMGFAGREWMLARGEAVAVSKIQSLAFGLAASCMALMAWAEAPLGWLAVMWFAPHACVWMAASSKMGLFARTGPVGPVGAGEQGWAGHGAYGIQALGHVALCSLDVVAAMALLGPQKAFAYVIYSRLAFAAFLASNAFASVFVGRAARARAGEWAREFYYCAAVHGFFALAAVAVLACAGAWLTGAWLGGTGLALGWRDAGMLAAACAGRSVAEAGMQTLSGPAMAGAAWSQGASSLAGLALFAGVLGLGWVGPMDALAMAWMVPSLCALAWVAYGSRNARLARPSISPGA